MVTYKRIDAAQLLAYFPDDEGLQRVVNKQEAGELALFHVEQTRYPLLFALWLKKKQVLSLLICCLDGEQEVQTARVESLENGLTCALEQPDGWKKLVELEKEAGNA